MVLEQMQEENLVDPKGAWGECFERLKGGDTKERCETKWDK
jgi:hypothetical protein